MYAAIKDKTPQDVIKMASGQSDLPDHFGPDKPDPKPKKPIKLLPTKPAPIVDPNHDPYGTNADAGLPGSFLNPDYQP
jgi:hypothetical protein